MCTDFASTTMAFSSDSDGVDRDATPRELLPISDILVLKNFANSQPTKY
jgi:hypothetical protein